jgi:anti-anti-sigma regulatory factor
MLKITIHDSAREFRLQLEGRLSGAWVDELRQCWLTASSTTQGRTTLLDLADVDFIDQDGQKLLADMFRGGVGLRAVTPLIRELVAEICEETRCGRVEGKPTRHSHEFVSPDSTRSDSRAV